MLTKFSRIALVALIGVFATQTIASADQIVVTVNHSGSGVASDSNLNPMTFVSQPFLLNQFDPTTGTLTSALLEWNFTTAAGVTPPAPIPQEPNPFMSGTVSFMFRTSSVSGSFINTTVPFNFLSVGPDGSAGLALGTVTGTGTFTAGTLEGILDLDGPSLFPVGVTGGFDGTVKVTYTFTPADRTVPEPASLMLLSTGLTTAFAMGRRRRRN